MTSAPETPPGGHPQKPSPDLEAVLRAGSQRSWSGLARRTLAWAAIVIAVVLVALVLWWRSADRAAVRYSTEPAARGDLTVIVTATGSAEPITQVNISSELSGTVRKVFVDYNSPVKAGDPLAELDADKLRATVENNRARLEVAKARVVEAAATIVEKRGEHERKATLAERRVISSQDLEIAKAAYDRAVAQHRIALAEISVAVADLETSEINLTKARIVSPIDGVILQRSVDPGQIVASSLQAPVLFVIAQDLRHMELQVDVDEADVGKVKVGQAAMFSVDAYPDHKFPAEIRDVRYGSEVVQGVVTYKAVLSIDNSELLIRPGMTATAEIVVEEVRDALLVPNAALRFAPSTGDAGQQGRGLLQMLMPRPPSARYRPPSPPEPGGPNRTVWVLRDGEPRSVAVVIGASDGRRTEIVEGDIAAEQPLIVDATASK